MRLEQVVAKVSPLTLVGDGAVEIQRIEHDSRLVEPGALFCCLVGADADGHDFAAQAVENGAVALLVERELPIGVPQAVVDDARAAMALAAAAFHGDPSHALDVVGVTGTNGKTTVTYLLRNVLAESGREPRVLGTLSGTRTTPEAPVLQQQLAGWRDEGVDAVAMEVSSHALALHRVDGTRFKVAVFTNLSRDHLDFHASMEEYFETKARLFDASFTDRAVVNLDSPYGRLLHDAASVATTGYSLDDVDDLVVHRSGSSFVWRGQQVELPLGGRFNVSNALAAGEAAVALGLDPVTVAAGLSRPLVVPGRFELIDEGQPFAVVVDYAHTPDGLEQLLLAARELAPAAEVTAVFGCGGDRDPTKRAPMGEVAARLADHVVLTSDNSRGEDTRSIIADIEQGIAGAQLVRADTVVEPDRREAIARALERADSGDVVVIAGKGHESTLTADGRTVEFDDRAVARDQLRAIAGRCR